MRFVRDLFPFVAFGAVEADAIALDFIFGDHLPGAILEDEALAGGLRDEPEGLPP